LAELLWPSFELRCEAILLASIPTPQLAESRESRTSVEAFYSHTHILDEFRHTIPYGPHPDPELTADCETPDWDHPDFRAAWDLTRTIGQMWLQKLRLDFPEWHFRVYCTKLDDPIVRFHRVRDGEPPWLTDKEVALQAARDEVIVYDSRGVPDHGAAI
jgi:hypothetical protein